jgi:DNA-binding NtrC family response regulator
MHVILLIDDDSRFLHIVADVLQRGDRAIAIEMATTAEQGLRLLGCSRFDAIISDFKMPGLNGIDLLKECAIACPNTPVILVTGYSSTALREDALRQGAYAVLEKPVDPDAIHAVLTEAILERRKLQSNDPFQPILPQTQLRDLTSNRARLSAQLKAITKRLEDALDEDSHS